MYKLTPFFFWFDLTRNKTRSSKMFIATFKENENFDHRVKLSYTTSQINHRTPAYPPKHFSVAQNQHGYHQETKYKI